MGHATRSTSLNVEMLGSGATIAMSLSADRMVIVVTGALDDCDGTTQHTLANQ
jgi:hypothetical protein